jgi:hypothetical protein
MPESLFFTYIYPINIPTSLLYHGFKDGMYLFLYLKLVHISIFLKFKNSDVHSLNTR